MFGIIDENKKFILIDENRGVLRTTALMLAKETEKGVVSMFTENNVDDAINEYSDENIEIAYNGDKYLKGYTPSLDREYQSKMREKAYTQEVDPITSHVARLRDLEQTPEVKNKISELILEREAKIVSIKEKYPY